MQRPMDVGVDPISSNPPTAAKSAASWGAILAGAFVAASASLLLIALGTGLGFAAVSPWRGRGISAEALAAGTVVWLIVTQWLSAAVGGYITGRLRVRWAGTHEHEVFFRDTANGLVTWAVATVLVAAVMASTAATVANTGAQAASVAASGFSAAAGKDAGSKQGTSAAVSPRYEYGVDKLLRRAPANPTSAGLVSTPVAPNAVAASNDVRPEVMRVMANALVAGDVPAEDRTYLINLVAARAGISTDEAQKRVDEFIASAKDIEVQAKAAADQGRKAAAKLALLTALAMLIGAFIASVSAALGGRLRDMHP
jgi:hypothetical protein